MSTPGNTAKLGTAHSNIQTAQSCPSLVGINIQCISQHTTELAHYPTMPAKQSKAVAKYYKPDCLSAKK